MMKDLWSCLVVGLYCGGWAGTGPDKPFFKETLGGRAKTAARLLLHAHVGAVTSALKTSRPQLASFMALQNVDSLSDESDAAVPVAALGSGKKPGKAETQGSEEMPLPKGASKPKAKKPAKRPAASEGRAPGMKRPAARAEPPDAVEPEEPEGEHAEVCRRPAAKLPKAKAAKAKAKASKYMYHKDRKWGIKYNGKEMTTAGLGSEHISY